MTLFLIAAIILITIIFLWALSSLKKKLDKKTSELENIKKSNDKQFLIQDNLVSVLSQELRTPLYGIMGLTSLLTDEHPEIKKSENLKSLRFTSEYLLTLVNNVLHVNFLNSNKISVKKSQFNIREVTQNIVNSFNYATETNESTIKMDFDHEIDKMIHGDASILSQILINLISNALRFSNDGNINFGVSLIKKENNNTTISFKINHNGMGISEKDQESIYQEFINVQNTKKSYLGTSIDLKIINKLAEALNGEVIILDNSAEGSEYALVVNFETKSKTAKSNKNGTVVSSSKRKALIVDDNKLNLLVADKMLSKEHFVCTTIDNGFDAIKLAEKNEYDVILMDINMPKLNGIGTTKRIREFNSSTPIIALTAVDVTQLNQQIVQAGLNDYILKPYNKNQLLKIINKNIENAQVSL